MNSTQRLLLLSGSCAVAALFALPSVSVGFATFGQSLSISTNGSGYQRDVRVVNNANDAAANNNVTPDANHPGALGATLAIWKATEAWNSNNPLAARNFDYDWQGETNSSQNNGNTVIWGDSGCGGGTLAYTITPITDGWNILMCESSWNWSDGPGAPAGGQIDIQGIAAHELGHALGLDHSNVGCGGSCTNDATMCAFACGTGQSARDLTADDQAGVNAVYGAIPGNKPSITGLSGSMQLGGALTITGTNFPFPGNVNVKFTAGSSQNTGSIPGVVFNVATTSSTQLTVTIPNTATDGNVLVWAPSISRLSNPFPIDVGGSAPATPVLLGTNPVQVTAFLGGTVTLTGLGFTGATSVDIGSITLNAPNFTIVNDTTITFSAPTFTALGLQTVTVTGPGGTSNPVFLSVVAKSPLTLFAPSLILNGNNYTWTWGGKPSQVQFMLVNLTGQTISFQGTPFLAYQIFVPLGTSSVAGTGSITAPIANVPAGVNLFTQIMTVAPPGTDINTVELSNIAQSSIIG